MKILHTHQISASVIEIIDEAKEYCFLVSPYLELWTLLERSLAKAARLKRRITFIVTNKDEAILKAKTIHKQYGFEFLVLDNLHTKLYCNERRALISSMNLYDYSQKNNHEIGALFDSASDAAQLLKEYIIPDLLSIRPRLHLPGYFHEGDRILAQEMKKLEEEMANLGFCVVCGTKIDLDADDAKPYNKTVRCKDQATSFL